jgi:hypothetical protein
MELLMYSVLKRSIISILWKQGFAVIFGAIREAKTRKHGN